MYTPLRTLASYCVKFLIMNAAPYLCISRALTLSLQTIVLHILPLSSHHYIALSGLVLLNSMYNTCSHVATDMLQ